MIALLVEASKRLVYTEDNEPPLLLSHKGSRRVIRALKLALLRGPVGVLIYLISQGVNSTLYLQLFSGYCAHA